MLAYPHAVASGGGGSSGGPVDLGVILALLGGAALGAVGGLLAYRALRRREAARRGRLAHDLRTPLSSILAYAELVEDGVPDSDRERFMAIIRHEAGRMGSMIDGWSGEKGPSAPGVPAGPAPNGKEHGKEHGATVLVVDDDRFIVEATCRLLAHEGFRAVGATGGAEAVEQARAGRPDLILLDLAMPVMDGGETLRRLRGEPATQNIPVIITTGDDAVAAPAGAFAVLTKPVSREMLLGAVTKALGAMRPREAMRRAASSDELAPDPARAGR